MLKIKKIKVENFRGLRLPLEIEFLKGGNYTSAILYGRNGTGKSSIVDAWEWLNSFEIQQLSREGVTFLDFPHRASHGNNCYISVDFHHSSINNVKAQFNPKKISTPILSGQYEEFKSHSLYPNYLRYSDLQAFVYKTKAERYKFITKFFGLERFTILQDTIQTSYNRLSSSLKDNESTFELNKAEINKIIRLATIEEASIITYLNQIATRYNINTISQFKNSEEIKIALAKIISTNPVAKELSEWKSFQLRQNQFYPISNPNKSCQDLENTFSDLKRNEENIKQLILSDLYESALEVIPKLDDKNQCPVCDNKYNGDLLDFVKNKYDQLEALNKKKNEFETKKIALDQYFTGLAKKIGIIQAESSLPVNTKLKSFFEKIAIVNDSLQTIISTIKKQIKDLKKIEISSDPAILNISEIIKNQADDQKIVSEKINELSKDEKTKTLAQDFSNVDQIIKNFKYYSINKKKIEYLNGIIVNLNSLFTLLTTYIQTTVQTTFSAISNDVVDCFNELEATNPFIKNPQIKLITGKDKAVELEIEFVSEKIIPAFKILSESQVNSFGLAIFLSAVNNFNKDFKFFILDDVVNSFDCFKRPRVSQLIAKKFKDFQVLIMTHDQIFFDTIQRDFPTWQRYKFMSWDFTAGPRYRLSQNYIEEIKEYLDDDKPLTAGQTLGRYIEWTLGAINESMQTPIRYRIENVYTLAEFYDPLVNRFRDKLKQTGKQHKLKAAFDEFEQGTIFRNYCVHWKNESNSFTSPEIDTILKKWIEIEKMIYCNDCKSFVKFDNQTGTEYIKCNCGKIDLKAPDYYI